MNALRLPICMLVWLMVTCCAAAESLPVFTDVTKQAGIDVKHSYGDFDLSNIVEGTGAGAMFFDYDGDGWLDIYFANGCWLKEVNDNRGRKLRGKLTNSLYRNNGDGTFKDVTQQAGVGDKGYGVGCSAADFDKDGDLDLYVLNYGPNVLCRNNGDGTFTDISQTSGLANPRWSLSAPWFDYDGDGDLDVYVANYRQRQIPLLLCGSRLSGSPELPGTSGCVVSQQRGRDIHGRREAGGSVPAQRTGNERNGGGF